jgi:hypothetical protein
LESFGRYKPRANNVQVFSLVFLMFSPVEFHNADPFLQMEELRDEVEFDSG